MRRPTPYPPPHHVERGAVKSGIFLIGLALLLHCTSGSDQDMRNRDIFSEATQLSFPVFTTSAPVFDGNIQAMIGAINARGDNLEATCAATAGCPAVATIDGIVTVPSNYGVAIGVSSGGCDTTDVIYGRSFLLQDANSAILVLYGMDPPTQDTAQATSAKYINNARNTNMAVFGDRLRITVTKVQKYGSGTNINAVVTDFDISTTKVISSRNSVPYTAQATAFTRLGDLYKTRRLEGYIMKSPDYVECPSASNTRQFQFNYQTGYVGKLCVGGTVSNCQNPECTCSGTSYYFQMSHNLGAGTLSGFDTGNSFSYSLRKEARIRMTGPIFPPQYNQADINLMMMVDQKFQVETLR